MATILACIVAVLLFRSIRMRDGGRTLAFEAKQSLRLQRQNHHYDHHHRHPIFASIPRSTTTTTLTSVPASRRGMLVDIATAIVSLNTIATVTTTTLEPANAFENKISTKYDDRPKRRGTKPKDLGVAIRYDLGGQEYTGLKPCGPAPNCFVSTDNINDDPDHVIPSWKWPSSKDAAQAWDELVDVISKYQPGQSNVDGGGFQIVTNDPQNKYLYVQFESLKNGYIDDFEAWVSPSLSTVEVRSSSRLGYLDFGVNAKRLNYIAKILREKGWDATGVNYNTHQGYVIENQLDIR